MASAAGTGGGGGKPGLDKFRAAAKKATAFSKPKEVKKKEDDILPVQVTLGKTKMVLTETGWQMGKCTCCAACTRLPQHRNLVSHPVKKTPSRH
jgi:hypothetical protein